MLSYTCTSSCFRPSRKLLDLLPNDFFDDTQESQSILTPKRRNGAKSLRQVLEDRSQGDVMEFHVSMFCHACVMCASGFVNAVL